MNTRNNTIPYNELFGYALNLNFRVPGRIHMLLFHMISPDSEEAVEFFSHFEQSDYSEIEKSTIRAHDIICYRIAGADGGKRENLIMYTVDQDGMVYRWGKYYLDEPNPQLKGHIYELQEHLHYIKIKGFKFIPPLPPESKIK